MSIQRKTRLGVLGLGVSMIACLIAASGATALVSQPEPAKPAAPAEKPAASLPKAEEILDRYVKETGGKEAYEKITSIVMTGEMTMAMGMKAAMKVQVKKPGKVLVVMTIPQFGDVRMGSDGETAWTDNTMQGAKIVEGKEKEAALEAAYVGSEANWRERYKEVKCVGEKVVEGRPAYEVEMVSKEGQKRTAFYDKENGLLTAYTMTISSPQGEMTAETVISDYKKVGDVLMPHKSKTVAMSQEMTSTMEKIEVNAEIPDSVFELPDSVKKLKEKKAKDAAPKNGAPDTTPEKK